MADGHPRVNGTGDYSKVPLFFSRSAIASASFLYHTICIAGRVMQPSGALTDSFL